MHTDVTIFHVHQKTLFKTGFGRVLTKLGGSPSIDLAPTDFECSTELVSVKQLDWRFP